MAGTLAITSCSTGGSSGDDETGSVTTSATGEESAAPTTICEILARPAPEPTAPAEGVDLVDVRSGSLVDTFLTFGTPSDVYVYLEPGTDDRALGDFADLVAEQPTVDHVVATVNADESFAEFQEMFADVPDITDDVAQEDLPPRVVVRIRDVEDTPAFVRFMESRPGVREVRVRSQGGVVAGVAGALFSTDRQRGAWRDLAADLRNVDAPWTGDAADVIELMMSDGTNGAGTPRGEARLISAHDGIVDADADCTHG